MMRALLFATLTLLLAACNGERETAAPDISSINASPQQGIDASIAAVQAAEAARATPAE